MSSEYSPATPILSRSELSELSRRSDLPGLLRLGIHLAALAAGIALVAVARGGPWQVPAMFLLGIPYVCLFAPLHECVHGTAFQSRRLCRGVAWLAGAAQLLNSAFYWQFHLAHHRHTQDPEKDPELAAPLPRTWWQYLVWLSGILGWWARLQTLVLVCAGRTARYPFLPAARKAEVVRSMHAMAALYAAILAVSIAFKTDAVLVYWLLPAVLAQPFLGALLLVEHTGCSEDANGLSNTRSTLAAFPVRLLMWNMPFHAEHHLYPSIPFHALPEAHQRLREHLAVLSPGYVPAHREVRAYLFQEEREGLD